MAGLASIEELISEVKDIERNIYEYLTEALKDSEAHIIDMNAEEQLFEQGINRYGVNISDYAPYSPFTIEIKLTKGQPTNRVTLRDEGDFHSSFYLEYLDKKIKINTSDEKTEKLLRKYGQGVLGLTDENLQEITDEYVKPFLINHFRKILGI